MRPGDRTFPNFKDQTIHLYMMMKRYANRCANAFLQQKLEKGDKISIMLPNCPEYIFIMWGSAKVGQWRCLSIPLTRVSSSGTPLTSLNQRSSFMTTILRPSQTDETL
jgi:acyl-coenzyme A synthetase/AMP-(fatty) acid ligase